MIKKYRTGRSFFGDLIETAGIDRETDKSVWIDGRRNDKSCGWSAYHNSWKEAKDYLLSVNNDKMGSLKAQMDRVIEERAKVNALPDEEIT